MLKIKDNVDLKELEKFGFENIMVYFQRDYKTNKNYFIINIETDSRKILCYDYCNNAYVDATPYIQDLIRAEKVEIVEVKRDG